MPEKYSAKDLKLLKPDPRMWDSVDISKEGFTQNLLEAACNARDFTRQFVTNHLPDEMRYLVCLGCSYDGNPLEKDERTFPEDYVERERFFESHHEASELLWRNGMVPEWINVRVADVEDQYTLIQFDCCGRFASNKKRMYHVPRGRAPFQVCGPYLPPSYYPGGNKEKFDLLWKKKTL